MKKIIFVSLIIAMGALGVYKATSQNQNAILAVVELNKTEAVAACETSSNLAENKGYCVREYNSTEDTCVQENKNDAVRCNGAIH